MVRYECEGAPALAGAGVQDDRAGLGDGERAAGDHTVGGVEVVRGEAAVVRELLGIGGGQPGGGQAVRYGDRPCSIDDVAGGALALRHLVDAGHRSIAYVSGPPHLKQVRDRREGAPSALAQAGLPAEALRELPTERLDVAAGRDAGARLLGLGDRPTAVFCANDLLALGVLQALYAAGVSVPDDLAIVGYDDIEFAAAAAVPLTSVRQPAVVMGALAAELLLEETESATAEAHEHRRVVLQPELVVRGSSRVSR
jgi:LacI family transcriptional regulator